MKFAERKSSLFLYLRAIGNPFWRQTWEYSLLVPLLPKRTNQNALSYRFWRVFVCVSLTRMSSTESSTCSSPELMDLSGCFSSPLRPSPNTSSSSSSSSSGLRSLRRKRRASNYLKGTARAPYKSRTLGKPLSPLAPFSSKGEQQTRPAACAVCTPVLTTLVPAFQAAGMHGPYLHNRHSSHPAPKKARTRQHRNVKGENDWILGNLFDSQGNYMFCCNCILAWIDVHKGRLARLRKVKQLQQLQPLQEMTKQQVDDSKLLQHVVMPEGVHVSLAKWWATLRKDHRVTIRYPHGSHGLTGKPSNRQDKQLIEVIIVTLIQYK